VADSILSTTFPGPKSFQKYDSYFAQGVPASSVPIITGIVFVISCPPKLGRPFSLCAELKCPQEALLLNR